MLTATGQGMLRKWLNTDPDIGRGARRAKTAYRVMSCSRALLAHYMICVHYSPSEGRWRR